MSAIVVSGGTATILLAAGSATLNITAEYASDAPCKNERITQAAVLGGLGIIGGVLWAGAAQEAEAWNDIANVTNAEKIGSVFGFGDLLTIGIQPHCDCS